MSICKYLDVSTAHIKPSTSDWIDQQIEIDAAGGHSELIAYHKAGYGWFIHVSVDDVDYDPSPPDLRAIFEYARKHECYWVMLDGDGDEIDGLQTYEW